EVVSILPRHLESLANGRSQIPRLARGGACSRPKWNVQDSRPLSFLAAPRRVLASLSPHEAASRKVRQQLSGRLYSRRPRGLASQQDPAPSRAGQESENLCNKRDRFFRKHLRGQRVAF